MMSEDKRNKRPPASVHAEKQAEEARRKQVLRDASHELHDIRRDLKDILKPEDKK